MSTKIAGWAILSGTAENFFPLLLSYTINTIDASELESTCENMQSNKCKK
jgi:hypothetical protein